MPFLETFANASARGYGAFLPSAAAGAYELISTAYGTGSSGTITFSSIPQTYKHLQIRLVSKGSSAGADFYLTFNGVGGTSYASHGLYGDNNGIYSRNNTSNAWGYIRAGAATSTVANAHGAAIIDILDYTNASINTTVRALAGIPIADASGKMYLESAVLVNTSAITSLQLQLDTGNITSSSRFSLYGIKG